MRPNYCLPIIKSRKTEVLQAIQSSKAEYQYFEVWLDYIEDLSETFIQNLIKDFGGKLILVFRRQNLDDIKMSLEQRLAILDLLDKTDAYVDLDITSQTAELIYIRRPGLLINTISSYHNYNQTPPTPKLREIIDTMKEYEPSVYKLATHCENVQDALRLLELLLEMKQLSLCTIILGMGSKGAITRVFGSIWGNEMIFAPTSGKEASAPGQLTQTQLKTIYKELGF